MLHICVLACKAMSWCLFFKMWRSHSARLFAFDLKKFCEGEDDTNGVFEILATWYARGSELYERNEFNQCSLRNVPCDSQALCSKKAQPRRRSLLGPLTAPEP